MLGAVYVVTTNDWMFTWARGDVDFNRWVGSGETREVMLEEEAKYISCP